MRAVLHRRFRAWLLLATFACTLASTQLSADHLGIIDTACGDVGLGGSEGSRVGVALGGPPQHCPVCHFLRAVSGATVADVVHLKVQNGLTLQVAAAMLNPVTVDRTTRASRGPPTMALSAIL